MRERPILFSAPMVRAILAGRKSQTRRLMSSKHAQFFDQSAAQMIGAWNRRPLPHGKVGDRLWVRETHAIFASHGQHRDDGVRWGPWAGLPTAVSPDGTQVAYFKEGFDRCDPGRWRPSIHMPRWASRITLEITGVRVERLQDISEADCWAEGIEEVIDGFSDESQRDTANRLGCAIEDARPLFCQLWESINGCGIWDKNPPVWVIEFKRVLPEGATP